MFDLHAKKRVVQAADSAWAVDFGADWHTASAHASVEMPISHQHELLYDIDLCNFLQKASGVFTKRNCLFLHERAVTEGFLITTTNCVLGNDSEPLSDAGKPLFLSAPAGADSTEIVVHHNTCEDDSEEHFAEQITALSCHRNT